MKTLPLSNPDLFAFCGQHCVICMVHKMKKKPCANCSGNCTGAIDRVEKCTVRICAEVKSNVFCKDCEKYPCKKIINLDLKYQVS